MSLMHTYMAHIPTIRRIDMALWDLAGKLLGAPVSTLLGGPFRDAIPMYSHGSPTCWINRPAANGRSVLKKS